MERKNPAATAVPITPATLGPMACIRRKFLGSASAPILWLTLAAIGTAETPAEPMRGLIFSLRKRFISFAKSNPPTVLNEKATNPKANTSRAWGLKKLSPDIVAPTDTPRKIVTIFMSSFWAALVNLFTTPDSLKRLPIMNMAISGAIGGTMRQIISVAARGKRILSDRETGRSWCMIMVRSFLVVSSFIIGGWMMGTIDM